MRHWRITRNSNVATKTGYTYISGTMTDRMTIPTANLRFSATLSATKLTPGDCNNDRQLELPYGHFARRSRNFWQSVVVAMTWLIICWARHHRKSRIWRGNLDAICFSSTDVIISGFGGHIDISGCRSVFCLLANIISHVHGLIPQCRWNFNRTVRSWRDISVFGFCRHFLL